MNPETDNLTGEGDTKPKNRLSFLSKFLWFFLLPHVIAIPLVWNGSASILFLNVDNQFNKVFDLFEKQLTLGLLPYRVFLPVAIVSFFMILFPWRSRILALVVGILFLLIVDGAGSVYFVSKPFEIDIKNH